MKLISRKIIVKPDVVYNLHIENDHNYIANNAVVKNCHSVKGSVLKTMLAGPMSHIPLRWGLTGTIPKEKFEFQALRCSIGNTVGQITAKELQDKGILSNCHIHIKQLQDNRVFGNFQTELKFLLTDNDRLTYIANMINDISKDGNTLVLLDRVQSGKDLEELLDDNAVFISGATKQKIAKMNTIK